VVKTLDRKLFRDLRRVRGQAIAIGLIILCGVASWVTVLIAYRGLTGTRDAYYREYRLADLFATVKKAPTAVADRLEKVPGVRSVRSRIVFEVTIDLPAVPEPCFGRVLSLPDRRRRVINDIHLAKGRWFEGDGNRETIVGDRFAKVHRLGIGDRIQVIMNNRKEALTIVGTALSPEYVYMIRGAGEILPDPAHFTVLWLSRSFAESAFDFKDAANEFVAMLDPRVPERQVIEDVDRVLDRYGGWGAYGRKDQISNRYLSDEIEGLKGTATMVPTVFLGVAAFVLHMLLGRLVRTQRTQIAVFRAFGYSTRTIAWHYVKLSLLISSAGAVIGTAVGAAMSRSLLEEYGRFYQFPMLRFRLEPMVIVSGVGVSMFFAVLGAQQAARRAARLKPADGMRPEAPGIFRRTPIERWAFLWRRIGFVWRMVVRSVARAKLRAAFTVGGVALSTSIILLALFSGDSMDEMIAFDSEKVNLQDIRVTFSSDRGTAALYEIRSLPGVRAAEPELIVPVKLVNGRREKTSAILGMPAEGRLRRVLDADANELAKPTHGLLLTRKLAEILGVAAGDELEVRVLEGKKAVLRLPVEGTVDEYLGAAAYADLGVLSRWIGEEEAMNSVRILADASREEELTRTLKGLPAVQSVTVKKQSVEVFRETLAASMGIMTGVLSLFSGVIAFGVIYNASRIALAEKERTLASLRVLGFTRREVAAVLSNENFLLTAVAIPLGLGLGALFCLALAHFYNTDLYRFPVVFRIETLAITAALIVTFTIVANLAVRRRLNRLNLVEALKSRE